MNDIFALFTQTPTQLTKKIDFDRRPEKKTPGGGFGPVSKSGKGGKGREATEALLTYLCLPHTMVARHKSVLQ